MKTAPTVLDPREGRQIPPGLCALAVMTKAPRAGQVKTRLTPPLTPEEAAALNICFLRDTAGAIQQTVAAGGARGVGVYTPAGSEREFDGILPESFGMILQRGITFGDRLIAAAEDIFRVGFHSLCLIDSDSPTVPPSAYSQAVAWLSDSRERIVLGPSDDGGYYLIGLNRMSPRVFEEIDWSTERVLKQTTERAEEIGVAVDLLPTGYDVDDRATLRRLCDELLADKADASAGETAPMTRKYLHDLISAEGRERIWPTTT